MPFNEGWGQFDAARIADEVRALDPTRVVDHASGWHDQGGGDLRSLHVYGRRFRLPRRRDGRPVVLSEYGGHSLRVEGHVYDDEVGLRLRPASARPHSWPRRFTRAARDGSRTTYPGACRPPSTPSSRDVEDELNGLLTYDREVLKLDVARGARGAGPAPGHPFRVRADSAYGGSHNEGTTP